MEPEPWRSSEEYRWSYQLLRANSTDLYSRIDATWLAIHSDEPRHCITKSDLWESREKHRWGDRVLQQGSTDQDPRNDATLDMSGQPPRWTWDGHTSIPSIVEEPVIFQIWNSPLRISFSLYRISWDRVQVIGSPSGLLKWWSNCVSLRHFHSYLHLWCWLC